MEVPLKYQQENEARTSKMKISGNRPHLEFIFHMIMRTPKIHSGHC